MEEVYSVKQISEIVGSSEEQVRRWIRNGSLKAERQSKKHGYRVKHSDLKEFLNYYPGFKKAKQKLDELVLTDKERIICELKSELYYVRKTIESLNSICEKMETTIRKIEEES